MLLFKHPRKKINWLLTLALVTAIFTSSCKKDKTGNFEMSDQEFVTQASSSNNFEVAADALAISKGTNVAIRNYGEHMVTDHSMAASEMKSLADRKGWTMTTDQFIPKHQANLAILANTSGADFDQNSLN